MTRTQATTIMFCLCLPTAGGCTTLPGELGGVGEGDGTGGDTGMASLSASGGVEGTGGDAQDDAATEDESGSDDTGGTGEAPSACDGALEVGLIGQRYLDPVKWTNAVEDLLPEPIVPPDVDPLAPDVLDARIPFYVGATNASAIAEFQTAAEAVANAIPESGLCIGEDEDTCLNVLARDIASRAWRRPVSELEATMMLPPGATPTERIQGMVETVLGSAEFYELTPQGIVDGDSGRIALDGRSIATRLASLVWNSVPDGELIAAVDAGSLASPQERRDQLLRMWNHPRTARMLHDYTTQWLGLDRLEVLDKAFAQWSDTMPQAVIDESGLFVEEIVLNRDGTLGELLSTPISVVNAELATLYGDDIDGPLPTGEDFELVDLDPERRGGLLTLTGPMSAWSAESVIGVSGRGYAVVSRLACLSIPGPPPGIDAGHVADLEDFEAQSRHEFQQELFGDNSCAGCHDLFDPTTFGFDNYDAIGRYQTTLTPAGGVANAEYSLPVDASGTVVLPLDGDALAYGSRDELLDTLRGSETVRECTVRMHLRFALGRTMAAEDACTVEQLTEAFDDGGDRISTLFEEIVGHESFALARLENPR